MKQEVMINVALLREVQAAIVETPTQFHVGEWAIGDIVPGATDKVSGSACIAGWTIVLGSRTPLSRLDGGEIRRLACDLLGVDDEQADRLFYRAEWPSDLQQQYCFNPKTLKDYQSNAQVAYRRIEVFIQSEGAH